MNNFILLLINLNRCVDNNLIFYEITRQRNLNIEAFFIAITDPSKYFGNSPSSLWEGQLGLILKFISARYQ